MNLSHNYYVDGCSSNTGDCFKQYRETPIITTEGNEYISSMHFISPDNSYLRYENQIPTALNLFQLQGQTDIVNIPYDMYDIFEIAVYRTTDSIFGFEFLDSYQDD